MRPMLSRKVVKGKQDRFIFLQAFAGFWEFGLETGEELIVGRQSCFASRRQVHFMELIVTRYLVLIRLFQQTTSCSVRGASPDVSENLARISVAVLQ